MFSFSKLTGLSELSKGDRPYISWSHVYKVGYYIVLEYRVDWGVKIFIMTSVNTNEQR